MPPPQNYRHETHMKGSKPRRMPVTERLPLTLINRRLSCTVSRAKESASIQQPNNSAKRGENTPKPTMNFLSSGGWAFLLTAEKTEG